MAFLADLDLRPLPSAYSSDIEFNPVGYTFGEGPNPLEVVVVQADRRPTATNLRAAWTKRSAGRASPILIVALHVDRANVSICGPVILPQTKKLPVYHDLEAEKTERICRSALDKPDRHAALNLLQDTLPEVSDRILGVLNQGLLATHELENGVVKRADWRESIRRGEALAATAKADATE